MRRELRELAPTLEKGARGRVPEPNVIVRFQKLEKAAANAPVDGSTPPAHDSAVFDEIHGLAVRRKGISEGGAVKNGDVRMEDRGALQKRAIDEGQPLSLGHEAFEISARP